MAGSNFSLVLMDISNSSLEPKAFHDEVKRTNCFQRRKAKEDEVVLHDLILEKPSITRDRDESDSGRPPAKQTNPKSVKKLKPSKEQSSTAPRASTKGSTDHPKAPPTPSSNCSETHWLPECKVATDDQKAEIRRKFRVQARPRWRQAHSGPSQPIEGMSPIIKDNSAE
ncbi:hypothetical protein PHMEG_00015536 [Phytophthora megakarya]|uniref:Uncharacterized protein n=1 Tax=Phytophthora megakarya TaxID=4795 RepID=A0A225W351_9STRA|nr:hypothetical protein PHMEG_00015536 [Phytophthora megakarya]